MVFLLMVAIVAAFSPLAQNVAASSAPGSVGSVSVSRSDGSLTASWSAPSGATKYHVTYSTDGGGSWHAPVSDHRNVRSTSLTFSADNSKTYMVGVRAGNEHGWGPWTNSPSSGPYTPPKRDPTPTPEPTKTPPTTPKPSRSLSFGSHTVADQSWTKDTTIGTLSLPAAIVSCDGVCTTIVPAMTYTLSPGLPAGASFDATARTISGTPTAEATSATYTYTATADGHTSASLTFSIAVNAPQSTAGAAVEPQNADLSFGNASIDDQSWHKDDAITTVTLPQATGGSGSITYGLSSLPAGLSFDASARTISGTPTATSASATYRYTATDGTDTVMLSFKIEVLEKAAIGCSSLKSSISVSASTNPSHTLYALALSINSANGSADQAKIEWKKKSDSTWSERTVDANISSAAIESLDSSTTYEVMFSIRFDSSHLDFGQCGWKSSDVAEGTTASPAVPNKPNAPTVAQNATTPKTQLDVDWTATYGAPKVSGYFVEYKKKSETNWIQWGNEYSSQQRPGNDHHRSDRGNHLPGAGAGKELPGQQLLVGPRRGEDAGQERGPGVLRRHGHALHRREFGSGHRCRRGSHRHRHRERHAHLLPERHRRILFHHRQRHRPDKGRLRHDAGLRIVHDLLLRDGGRQRPEGQQRHGGHGGGRHDHGDHQRDGRERAAAQDGSIGEAAGE